MKLKELKILVLVFAIVAALAWVQAAVAAATNDIGRATFEKRCTGCHSLDKNKEGPRLRGVVGRQSASIPDFEYSAALKQANVLWGDESLDRWLKDPESVAPDNDMSFHVGDEKERKDIIAYLKSVSGK